MVSVIAGEISNDGIVFLILTNEFIILDLYLNHQYYCTYTLSDTNRVVVPITNVIYTFKSNDIIISEHDFHIDRLIFLSCDMPGADTKNSLWNSFDKQSGLCIHIGDNIYGDGAYNLKSYNDLYLKTWSRWAPLMTNFSHMMVADDHEICDGYDYTVRTTQRVKDGLTIYHKYQTSLLYNYHPHFLIPGFFIKSIDNVVVYGLSRTVMKCTPLEMIKRLKSTFRGNIILAISSAPVPLTSELQYKLYNMMFGSFGWDQNELIELYDLCFELLESKQVSSVTLIGGDLHFGITGIIKKGCYKIYLYVTSGISANPTMIEYLLSNSMNCHLSLGEYGIELSSKAYRNYLSIPLPFNPNNPGRIIYSMETQPCNMIEYSKEMINIVKPKLNYQLLNCVLQELL